MDASYKEVTSFKFQANLLFAESVLQEKKIPFKSKGGALFKLFVKEEDYSRALEVIYNLNLDESEVDPESDGYIAGYEEWADKRYVNGYFTGGVIPRWMYSKVYAQYYGIFIIASSIFYFFVILNDGDAATYSNIDFSWGVSIPILTYIGYFICGILLIIRGFKSQK